GVPPVNISEKNDGFIIEMAAPGYKKEDFAVNVDKNLLTISVHKKTEKTENSENNNDNKDKNEAKVYRREYSFSSFSRSFTLPEGVDAQKIGGSYTDGILKLEIPKCEVQNTKKAIEIK
ncbi:MAG: Hsp20/alpha crystallin family protein, partial [Bacteroidales bacterium]|nr:Hsp20/alpha crystallin family protein [Bacteroidales bacterium]